MVTRNMFTLTAVVLAFCTVGFWGCPKRSDVTSAPETGQEKTSAAAGESQAGQGALEDAAQSPSSGETAGSAHGGLQPIHFDFDRSTIRDDARAVLKANADWLKAHPAATVRIEGNCDERGTIEYNQALGQRRAAAARKYLVDLGISAQRIALVSYGKEKPLCGEATEACWQRNRRDEFIALND